MGKEEYDSLRQELLEHQGRRIPILSLALTISIGLFATGLELNNPYLPLFALLLLHTARIQIAQAHYGVQRISAYIRVMYEEGSQDFNWETGSYQIRLNSIQKQKKMKIWSIYPLSSLDAIMFVTGLMAIIISFALSSNYVYSIYIVSFFTVVWLGLWVGYSFKLKELVSMKIDQEEEKFWRTFKLERSRKPVMAKNQNQDQNS